MDGSTVLAFAGVSMLFALTPGADWAFAISSGIARRGVVPTVSGLLAGHLTATLLVAVGVAAVVATSEFSMVLLTAAGASYLIWLGVTTLRQPAVPATGAEGPSSSAFRQFATGIGISLLNPKVFLLFLALLPQFTIPEAGTPVGLQMIVLGGVHVLNCAVVYLVVGFGARSVLGTRPQAARAVSLASGAAMVGLGLVLLADRVLPHLR